MISRISIGIDQSILSDDVDELLDISSRQHLILLMVLPRSFVDQSMSNTSQHFWFLFDDLSLLVKELDHEPLMFL